MARAICKTCAGFIPYHVPSMFDPDGIGHPAHKLTKHRDTGLRCLTYHGTGQKCMMCVCGEWHTRADLARLVAEEKMRLEGRR